MVTTLPRCRFRNQATTTRCHWSLAGCDVMAHSPTANDRAGLGSLVGWEPKLACDWLNGRGEGERGSLRSAGECGTSKPGKEERDPTEI